MRYIYKITNIVNNKVYIGQSGDPNKRWRDHKNSARCIKRSHLASALALFGINNFLFEIIDQAEDQLIDLMEIEYIKKYNSTDPCIGYNVDHGGYANKIMSDATKLKLSVIRIGKKLSKKTKKKLSNASIGRKHTDEAKEKISKANKQNKPKKKYIIIYPNVSGKHLSDETKLKLSLANIGKKASQETLEKMSKSMIGKNKGQKNGMFGTASEKHTNAKLTQVEADDIREKYSSGKISSIQLSKEYNVSKKTILNILHNKTYTKK